MTEPTTQATEIETLAPGILNWTLTDNRINHRSDAYAVSAGDRWILMDPLPLEEMLLGRVEPVEAIVLSGSCHQRSSWRYRRRYGVPVWAPEGAENLEEEPTHRYGAGTDLPGGLKPIHAPGPTEAFYAFLLEREGGILFCTDLMVNDGKEVKVIPDQYVDDPGKVRATCRRLLDLPFGTLCFHHGPPLRDDPHAAIRKALEAAG